MRFSLKKMAGLPAIAAAAFFMQALDATILNTALPDIARSLDRSPLAMQLAVVGYTLTVAMLIPISGWMADRFGTRRVFVVAVGLFSGGSLLCALSGSLPMLVASRVVQGIGGAMMMPVTRLAVLRAYPRAELVSVLDFISIPGLVGPVAGPLLGGWLVTYATWHWIFLINIPIGVIGILYAYRVMPDFTAPRRPFDFTGFFLFGLHLVTFSSGLEVFGNGWDPRCFRPCCSRRASPSSSSMSAMPGATRPRSLIWASSVHARFLWASPETCSRVWERAASPSSCRSCCKWASAIRRWWPGR